MVLNKKLPVIYFIRHGETGRLVPPENPASTKIGRRCILAGQIGTNQHITIGDGAIITARTGVTKSVEAGKLVGSEEQQAKGLANQVEGKVQKKVGDVKDAVETVTRKP